MTRRAGSSLISGLVRTMLVIIPVASVAATEGARSAPSTADYPAPETAVAERRAIDRWMAGDRDAAIAAYRELVAQNPEDDSFRASLTILLREAGDFEEALQLAEDLPLQHAVTGALAAAPRPPVEEDFVNGVAATTGDGAPAARDPAAAEGEIAFWQGVAALRAGNTAAARVLLRRSIDQAPGGHRPYAHFYLGHIAEGAGNRTEAIARYRRTLRQDPAVSEAVLPLARLEWDTGRKRQAYDRLFSARLARPWDRAVAEQLANWAAERPDIATPDDETVARRRRSTTPPTVTPAPAEVELPAIRVGLAEGLRSVYLKSGGPFAIAGPGYTVEEDPPGRADSSAATTPSAPASPVIRAHIDGDTIILETESDDPALLYRGPGPVRLQPRAPSNTTVVFDLTYGTGQFRAGREDRSYRGAMEIRAVDGTITVINELSVEAYLYSVVPSEMPALWPAAALEAQAVAARSYTLHPRDRYRHRGFDVLSSVSSAHYTGVSGEHPRSTAAVDATRGLVLMDGNRPLDAVYSANHGGYGEAAGSVWGWPNSLVETADPLLPPLENPRSPGALFSWLTGRPDAYSGRAPYADPAAYRWQRLVPRRVIEERLAVRGQPVGPVIDIIPGTRGLTGRVESVTVIGDDVSTEVRRDAIRSALGGLRSNLFLVTPVYADSDHELPSHFLFFGAGWGHGVGLDQTGAAGMAADGYSAREILRQYYPRNSLRTLY